MTYEDLLTRLEDLVCDVVDRVLKSPAAPLLYEVNPVSLAQILQHSALLVLFYSWVDKEGFSKPSMTRPKTYVIILYEK